MIPSSPWFRKTRYACAVSACAVVVPGVLALSGVGFLRAHAAGGASAAGRNFPEAGTTFAQAVGAAEVRDGHSLCFEFTTGGDGPLWVLLQNRPGGGGGKPPRGVLVSRTPGFEDARVVRTGSAAEQHLVDALGALARRDEGEVDARVRGNLARISRLIVDRHLPCPPAADWYFY